MLYDSDAPLVVKIVCPRIGQASYYIDKLTKKTRYLGGSEVMYCMDTYVIMLSG